MDSFGDVVVKKEISSRIDSIIKVSKDVSYYDTEYLTEFPVGNYYTDNLQSMPLSICINDSLGLEAVDTIINLGFVLIWSYQVSLKKRKYPSSQVYKKDGTLVVFSFKKEKKYKKGSVNKYSFNVNIDEYDEEDCDNIEPSKLSATIYYLNYEESEIVHSELIKCLLPNSLKSKISLLVNTSIGLSASPQIIKSDESLNIELNYGKDFLPVHKKILDKLNEDNGKGLVLLHGTPGTGKTSYIKYLCHKLKKEVIFLPPNLTESISSPDFVPFLLDHVNSILVIEDAEKVVFDRESGGSSRQGVSSILNMTDGILSDCLSIQIIATFNTSRDKIDKALLRKGRLIAEWKFDELSIENSNKLLSSLSKNYTAKSPMTLSDIYNLEESVNVVQQERTTIGFKKY